jgi:hypothetical protein
VLCRRRRACCRLIDPHPSIHPEQHKSEEAEVGERKKERKKEEVRSFVRLLNSRNNAQFIALMYLPTC